MLSVGKCHSILGGGLSTSAANFWGSISTLVLVPLSSTVLLTFMPLLSNFLSLRVWWSSQMHTLFPWQDINPFLPWPNVMDIQCCYGICISQTDLPFLSMVSSPAKVALGSLWTALQPPGRAVLDGSVLNESEQSPLSAPVFSKFPCQAEKKMHLWFFLSSPQSLKWWNKF